MPKVLAGLIFARVRYAWTVEFSHVRHVVALSKRNIRGNKIDFPPVK